jgi:4-amino-4-deoxy-L-arabinose transferase-like glycosyltransferase
MNKTFGFFTYRHALILTWLLIATGIFVDLGGVPLSSLNEGRRALPVLEMIQSGDWLTPTLNGELYITKPPLFYWLSAVVSELSGAVNEWTVRLPSAVSALVISIVCFRWMKATYGDWAALFTLQLIGANAGLTNHARLAEIEMLLTALCVGAIFSFWSYVVDAKGLRWIWAGYALLGLAALTKGPLALIFVWLPFLIYAAWVRSTRSWRVLWDPIGWLICLGIGLSWYGALTWRHGMDVWQSIIAKDVVEKVAGSSSDPIYSYLLWIGIDFFPFALVGLVMVIIASRRKPLPPLDHRALLLIITILAPVLVYSLIAYKNDKYLLPIYPLIAMGLGIIFSKAFPYLSAHGRSLLFSALMLFPLGYAVTHIVIAPQVTEHRYSAFNKIKAWRDEHSEASIFTIKPLDPRTIFYLREKVPVISSEDFQRLQQAENPFYLITDPRELDDQVMSLGCMSAQISPYLKPKRTLAIVGYGVACRRSF